MNHVEMYFHSKTGDKGHFLQPFLQEKRRVLTAFKLLQGPSGNARLGDWLQRWGEKWDGPKGLPWLIFDDFCFKLCLMFCDALSLSLYDSMMFFFVPVSTFWDTHTEPKLELVSLWIYSNFLQLSPELAQNLQRDSRDLTNPDPEITLRNV